MQENLEKVLAHGGTRCDLWPIAKFRLIYWLCFGRKSKLLKVAMENGAANSVEAARLDCETLAENEDEDAVIFRCDTLTDWGFGDFHCDSLAAEFAHGQAQQKVFGHGVPEAEKFCVGQTAEECKLDMEITGNGTSSYRVAENGSSHEEAVNLHHCETEFKKFSRDPGILANELSFTGKPCESVREIEHTGLAFVTDGGFQQGVKIESCVEARQEEDFDTSDDGGSPGAKGEGDLSLHDSHRNCNEEYNRVDDVATSVVLQIQQENSDFRLTEEDDHRSHNTVAVIPLEGNLEHIADTRADTVQEEEGVKDGWEAARAWLWRLPRRRNVLYEEMEEWLQINKRRLSREIVTMPRGLLFRFLVSQHKLMRRTEQMENLEVLEPPTARFRRSDKWKPVYAWLETLDSGSVVGAKAIDAWLSRNPDIKDDLLGKHTRHHLFHYIQKCHTNIIKKKKRELLNGPGQRKNEDKKRKRKRKALMRVPQKSGVQLAAHGFAINRPDAGASKNVHDPADQEFSSVVVKASDVNIDSNLIDSRQTVLQAPMVFNQDGGNVKVFQEHRGATSTLKEEARRKYEILSELQAQLLDQILQARDQLHMASMNEHTQNSDQPSTSTAPLTDGSVLAGNSAGVPYIGFDGQSEDVEGRLRRRFRDFTRARSSLDMRSAKRRRKGKEKLDNAILSWSYSEVLTGSSNGSRSGFDSHSEKGPPLASTSKDPSLLEQATSKTSGGEIRQPKFACSPVRCLQEREIGANAGSPTSPFLVLGKGRWKSFFEGWSSLERQFTGCSSWLQRRSFSSWLPCWSAYTSSVAVALPLGMVDQGVQKVLDVRFHPQNNAQLVCSSNAAPNELLLYDLLSGKVTELAGHNCQIQAVEYAARGERIISCGSNLLKIWDSTTGTCLHTLGPGPLDENASGHKKKINAMAVNQDLPYLVATSGGQGDSQVLLWNINRGELVCDLNGELRNHLASLPCMDALEFCNQNILICGSDSSGGPAIVQIWDVQAPQNVTSFPANESYITSLNVDPMGQIIASGAGDGSVALSDVRTCAGIVRLPLGSGNEVTSVSFSSCGRYLQASSTANRTFVWDMRIMPMDPGPRPTDNPLPLTDNMSRKARSLHCLSHGAPMPTSENAGQMPGFVDEGDQGVNDARWFHNEPVLVTVSGNGSVAMWDMTLGDTCIQHMTSHSRCINTVAVSPNDKYICSGGDDQKVVLYHNTRDKSSCGWRLTHPLLEEATND